MPNENFNPLGSLAGVVAGSNPILGLVVSAVQSAVTQSAASATAKTSQAMTAAHETSPDAPLSPTTVAKAQAALDPQAIAREVLQRLQHEPEFQQAKAETAPIPFYQSPVMIGGIVAMFAPLAGLLGYSLSPQDQSTLIAVIGSAGSAIGGAVVLWGRIRARLQPVKAA